MIFGVSIILIHYGSEGLTRHVLERFISFPSKLAHEIIVVDNGTTQLFQLHEQYSNIILTRLDTNRGYAVACNHGSTLAQYDTLLFLNNDIEFDSDIVTPLAEFLRNETQLGIIVPRLLNSDGSFQVSFGLDPTLENEFKERRVQRECRERKGNYYVQRELMARDTSYVDWATGAALMIKANVFSRVNGFDERYFFYFEDADLCRRVRQIGFQICFFPQIVMTHFGGGSKPSSKPEILRAYRAGQLLYYSQYNSRISFVALKLYLSARYFLLAVRSKTSLIFTLTSICQFWKIKFRSVPNS